VNLNEGPVQKESRSLAALADVNLGSQTQGKLFGINVCLLCCWGPVPLFRILYLSLDLNAKSLGPDS